MSAGSIYWKPLWMLDFAAYAAAVCGAHPPMATYCYICEKDLP